MSSGKILNKNGKDLNKRSNNNKRLLARITSKAIAVRSEPAKYGPMICQLQKDVFVHQLEERIVESIVWFRCHVGWICSMDSSGFKCYVNTTEMAANKSWAAEFDNRRRIASAIAAMLTKSHSLTNARRVSRSLLKYVHSPDSKNLINLPDVSLDDLLISLSSSINLRQMEVLEFLKITASQQSNPLTALVNLAEDIDSLMTMRPSLWVTKDLGVLETHDTKARNDRFVMSAARNDMNSFESFLAHGQELAAVHSELGYTALHAAADFGSKQVLLALLKSGVSVDIRDIKKGQTALHFAGKAGRIEISQILLDSEADRKIASYNNMLAYELAIDQGHYECSEVLKNVPSDIQDLYIIGSSSGTISIKWVPPFQHLESQAPITDYMIEWVPLGNSKDVGFGGRFKTTNLEFTISDLIPSTGHSFIVYSRSVSGWSLPSSKITQFTKPAAPDAPPLVEILKITSNALYLNWHAPHRDNGSPVVFYQIEIISYKDAQDKFEKENQKKEAKEAKQLLKLEASALRKSMKQQNTNQQGDMIESSILDDKEDAKGMSDLDEDSGDEFSYEYNEFGEKVTKVHELSLIENSPRSIESIPISVEKTGNINMHHRILKHSKPLKQRFITGLDPNCQYLTRVRCSSELGFSHWSPWSGPQACTPGVYILKFNVEEKALKVGWFSPILSENRKITAFEVQIAQLSTGYVTKNINVYSSVISKDLRSKKEELLNYETITNALLVNELDIPTLKAGGKYVIRVRSKIDKEWLDWDISVKSDIIIVPPTAPDPPFDVGAAFYTEEDPEIEMDKPLRFLHEQPEIDHVEKPRIKRKVLDVSHDNLVIKWTNGISNGQPVSEYQIDCAKVRDYRVTDQMLASHASNSNDDVKMDSEIISKNDTPEESTLDADTIKSLSWVNVTKEGDLIGPLSFRAKNLIPGSSYVFRVRQFNECGWSDFSPASPLITTTASLPPGRPFQVSVSAFQAVLQWKESMDERLGLTNLEYQVQIASLPSLYDNEYGNSNDKEWNDRINSSAQWNNASTRPWEAVNEEIKTNNVCVAVMIDLLTASTVYVVRVRVRTVAGWSVWSNISCEFRTLD
jgi:hypothetical protein